MTIPIEIAWGIIIALMGFILGTLWGHHGAILRRVKYDECSMKRKDCPCFRDVEELREQMKDSVKR